jgi:hypothetical protein
VQKVKSHNEKYERGETTFTLGINKFSDRTLEELQKSTGIRTNKDTAKNLVTG